MSNTATTDYTPIDFQYQEMDFQYQEVEFTDLEPMNTTFTPMKVDWLEAKTLYLTDHKLSYQDIANKYGVSLKQVKKWGARQQWRQGRQEVSNLAQNKREPSRDCRRNQPTPRRDVPASARAGVGIP